jgi:hypothetical protein
MTLVQPRVVIRPTVAERDWAEIAASAPALAATAQRYLAQLDLSLHHNCVARTGDSLRRFCRHLVGCYQELRQFSEVGRAHVESYKLTDRNSLGRMDAWEYSGLNGGLVLR